MASDNYNLAQTDFLNLFSHQKSDSVPSKIFYNYMPEQKVTFVDGLNSHAHCWFKLTPSFSPYLVRKMLSTLDCGTDDVILDPFAGAGTTLIECQLEGLTSYGFEINPFLHFVCETSLNWELDTVRLQQILNSIVEHFSKQDLLVRFKNLADFGLRIPKIHNPTRWWRPDILKQLLVLKSCINSAKCTDQERAFFRLALAAVLVPNLTNVIPGKLQLVFADRSQDDIQVVETFVSHAKKMIADLNEIHTLVRNRTSKTFLIDTKKMDGLELPASARCVITSPPYPNRYSYVWNTRPHLYFFDFFQNARQATNLDKETVGGTWGSATSDLAKGEISAQYPIVSAAAGTVVKEIRQVDNLMANYAMKYFNSLAHQIKQMDRLLTRDVRIAYVVGCSKLKGVYVETDVILGKIIEGLELGYRIKSVERIRKRHSGKNLYESIIYAWKV